jgi:hypothetical protein
MPQIDTLWMIPRLVNAGLAVLTIVVLIIRFPFWWSRDSVYRAYWLGLVALLFAAAEGSVEQVIQHNPPGPRVVLITVALVWTATAALRSVRPRRRRNARP